MVQEQALIARSTYSFIFEKRSIPMALITGHIDLYEEIIKLKAAVKMSEAISERKTVGNIVTRTRHRNGREYHEVYKSFTGSDGINRNVYLSESGLKQETELIEKYCAAKVLPVLKKALKETADPQHYCRQELQETFENLYSCFGKYTPKQFLPDRILIQKWLSTPVKRDYRTEDLRFRTARGDMVRSKFELMIADVLYALNIPYQYEMPVKFNNRQYLPDFSLLDIIHGKIIYLEAFGMMDNRDYAMNCLDKLKNYEAAGIYPGEKLIVVYDSLAVPFEPKLFQEHMRQRFLIP